MIMNNGRAHIMLLQIQQDPPAIYTNTVFLPTTVLPIANKNNVSGNNQNQPQKNM